MSSHPKILLLCNSSMAMPLLMQLYQEGQLAGIAVPGVHDFVHQPFAAIARQLNIPFTTLHKETYRETLFRLADDLNPDAVFVLSFPWMIPVSAMPACRYGWLNFHGGLLPEMRGSDPMFECIRKQVFHTGVTVHLMDDGMDTGPIVLQEPIVIHHETTHGMLSAQIAHTGAALGRQLTAMIGAGAALPATPQDEAKAVYIPRPAAEDSFVDWQEMTAAEIRALVNAGNPQLKGATVIHNGWKFGVIHVTEINLTGDDGNIKPGTILYADPQQGLIIYCRDGKALRLDTVYTEEGYFPGYKLALWGLQPGLQLAGTEKPTHSLPLY